MATGGKKILSSLRSVKGSDFVFDFTCDPCDKEGNTNEAINFCVDCSEYFCLVCTKQHTKFRATSGHNVVNITLANKVGGAPQPGEVCREHHGENITIFCADHDLVLCNTCAASLRVSDMSTQSHKTLETHVVMILCGGISYIPKVAGGSKHNLDIKRVQQEVSESLKAVSQTKLSLQNLLTAADEEKEEHLKRIRDCTEHLIKHARDLEKSAVDDVNGCHKTTTDTLRSEIRSLDDVALSMNDRLKNLDNVKLKSESQVFVDIKRGRQEVEIARKLNRNLAAVPAGKAMPEFVVKDDVDYFLNEVLCLGQYVEKTAYKAALYGEYDVGMSGDKYVCGITGSCELSDGTIIIVDTTNSCIKKLDKSYKIIERLNMPPRHCDICQTGVDEVAVTLTGEKKVQFVNVRDKLKMTRSFKVSEDCSGIMCSRGELFVSCGGHPEVKDYAAEGPGFVGVYSMAGSLIRKIELDQRGQQIFAMPLHITATDNGNKLHIADWNDGVITVDRQGHVLSTFSDGLRYTTGVCTVTDDNLLVCGGDSNNVLQISADGEMVAQLLGEEDGIKDPLSLLFLAGSPRLILTQNNSDKIKVFSLVLL